MKFYLCKSDIGCSSQPGPTRNRGVAQPGRAPALGAGGRRSESGIPDHIISNQVSTPDEITALKSDYIYQLLICIDTLDVILCV